MKISLRTAAKWLVLIVFLAGAAGVVVLARGSWLPAAERLIAHYAPTSSGRPEDPAEQEQAEHAEDDHDDQDHAADAGREPYDHQHDEAAALRLSKQAEANIRRERVELRPFARTISVPATVVERPGRSKVQITAPFTGLVTGIHRVEGEAITPGMPLFDLQLTHEELVEAQAEFLRIAEELEVVRREVARVAGVVSRGALAGKSLLQRQYEQQKLEAALHAQRQRLLLHRLTPQQVDGILKNRKLLQDLTVFAPSSAENGNGNGGRLMQVQELKVERGQHVAVGAPLCTLADHARLHVRGAAFEQDIPRLVAAVRHGWTVTAVFQSPENGRKMVGGLKILYLANEVEMQSRAFYFYVTLPNEVARDTRTGAGQRFIDWKFKPGQRLRLLVPVEPATERIVLPVESVVRDGAEAYVFEYNRDHFDRRIVQVEYRDQDRVVIANDGSLKPGVEVAVAGAYQIHLATKNKGGQAIDAHAGHQH